MAQMSPAEASSGDIVSRFSTAKSEAGGLPWLIRRSSRARRNSCVRKMPGSPEIGERPKASEGRRSCARAAAAAASARRRMDSVLEASTDGCEILGEFSGCELSRLPASIHPCCDSARLDRFLAGAARDDSALSERLGVLWRTDRRVSEELKLSSWV